MAEGTKVLSEAEFQRLNQNIRKKFRTLRNFYEELCKSRCAPTRDAAEQAHRRIKQQRHGLSDRLRNCYAKLLEIADAYVEFDRLLTESPAAITSNQAKSQLNALNTAQEPPGRRLYFDHLIDYHTALFAGREGEQRQILDFVHGHTAGYVFIQGLSGYGKTSLLAKLVRDHPHFAYHFISQAYKTIGSRFDPTELDSLLANLCEQLEPDTPLPTDSHGLRLRFQRFLQSPHHEPAVLVLDGIDEVDRHPNYLFGLLPHTLRGHYLQFAV